MHRVTKGDYYIFNRNLKSNKKHVSLCKRPNNQTKIKQNLKKLSTLKEKLKYVTNHLRFNGN